jgi:hypothetical protein
MLSSCTHGDAVCKGDNNWEISIDQSFLEDMEMVNLPVAVKGEDFLGGLPKLNKR